MNLYFEVVVSPGTTFCSSLKRNPIPVCKSVIELNRVISAVQHSTVHWIRIQAEVLITWGGHCSDIFKPTQFFFTTCASFCKFKGKSGTAGIFLLKAVVIFHCSLTCPLATVHWEQISNGTLLVFLQLLSIWNKQVWFKWHQWKTVCCEPQRGRKNAGSSYYTQCVYSISPHKAGWQNTDCQSTKA